jgi:hypothetical protein
VVASLEKIVGERGANRVVLHPHSYLEGFYRGMGYSKIEGRAVVGTHELITMEKRLRGGRWQPSNPSEGVYATACPCNGKALGCRVRSTPQWQWAV